MDEPSVPERPEVALSRLRQDLDDVEAAIRRMDEGTYGRCEECGGEIAPRDLEAAPAARRCSSCS